MQEEKSQTTCNWRILYYLKIVLCTLLWWKSVPPHSPDISMARTLAVFLLAGGKYSLPCYVIFLTNDLWVRTSHFYPFAMRKAISQMGCYVNLGHWMEIIWRRVRPDQQQPCNNGKEWMFIAVCPWGLGVIFYRSTIYPDLTSIVTSAKHVYMQMGGYYFLNTRLEVNTL